MLLRWVLVRLRRVLLLLLLRADYGAGVAAVNGLDGLVHVLLAGLREDTHDHGAGAMGALVLTEVVGAGELLATVGALKGLLVGVQGSVVALEVFLTSEAAAAEGAHEGLGGVVGQRLLAAAARHAAALGRGRRGGLVVVGGGLRGRVGGGCRRALFLGGRGGLGSVLYVLLPVSLALWLAVCGGGVLRDGVVGDGWRVRARRKFIVAEALLAEEAIVLEADGGEALALGAVVLDVVAGVRDHAPEFVFDVELENWLKGWEAGVEARLGGFRNVDLRGCQFTTLDHQLFELVAAAQGRHRRELDSRRACHEVSWVAHILLRSH